MAVLLAKAEKYASSLLRSKLSKDVLYHTLEHTLDVVSSASEIGSNSGLSKGEMEIVLLASWFHDTGYTLGPEDHEAKSVEIFNEFAHENGIEEDSIIKVIGCIMATKMPQTPNNLLEEVVCDADLLHLGKEGYFEKSALLCNELKSLFKKKLSDHDWMQMNKSFIEQHKFFTPYAQKEYRPKKLNNLQSVIRKLKSLHNECGA
ncbi:HD domain-containing protein [Reichenbachiella versicolor]|uniref:HD domain-containing protein n=1 Tax=Reichenbachiella versicolor TaxID=1821036 RepID=UPI000D6E873F|nr:HD domain-containing protein [Reichenbachiella versicolor]